MPDSIPASTGRRVVITGLGAVTAAGRDVSSFWSALLAARQLPEAIDGYAPREDMDPEATRLLGRCSLLAADAAIQAMTDARVPVHPDVMPQIAVVMGSARGEEASLLRWASAEDEDERRLWRRRASTTPAAAVARTIAAAGPCRALQGGPASGLAAVAEGYELIRRGEAAFAVCGGADAAPSMPLRDDAPPLAEGAAVLLLEDAEVARSRGAEPYAEVLGHASTFNRAPVAGPAANRLDVSRALQSALARAHATQAEADCLFATAPANPEVAEAEVQAIRRTWGPRAARLHVTTLSGVFGDLQGACGAAAAAAAALSIRHGVIPPAAGAQTAGLAEHADLVTQRLDAPVRRAVINACGRGQNTALVLGAPEEKERTI